MSEAEALTHLEPERLDKRKQRPPVVDLENEDRMVIDLI